MQHTSDGASLAVGAASVLISKVFGWITFVSFGQAFLLGAAGAAGGWALKKTMEFIIWLYKKQKSKRKSIKKSTKHIQ